MSFSVTVPGIGRETPTVLFVLVTHPQTTQTTIPGICIPQEQEKGD
jgi:hypothetical protein